MFARPLDVTFAALLETASGRTMKSREGTPMPMKIEPWPGGRWYRDLGDGNGHFWGHVQAIKRPTLLEISGPLFMSYPVVSNLQYRLTESNGETTIKFPSRRTWIDPGGSQKRSIDRLEPNPRART